MTSKKLHSYRHFGDTLVSSVQVFGNKMVIFIEVAN